MSSDMKKFTIVYEATAYFYHEVEAESLNEAKSLAWDAIPKRIDNGAQAVDEVGDKCNFDVFGVWEERDNGS